jgi:hypothetical protein
MCAAIDKVLGRGTPAKAYPTLDRYLAIHADGIAQVSTGDQVAQALLRTLRWTEQLVNDDEHPDVTMNGDKCITWTAMATDLLASLDSHSDMYNRGKGWPRTPGHLTARLRRLAPSLRADGIEVDCEGRRSDGAGSNHRTVVISWTPQDASLGRPSRPSRPSRKTGAHSSDGRDGRDGATNDAFRPPLRVISKRPWKRIS